MAARAGWQVTLFERSATFGEFGAGIQMGPNVVKQVHAWGLARELEKVAAFPNILQVRNALSGAELGVLRLGYKAVKRYGAPYATIHRGDLHQILLNSVEQENVSFHLQSAVDHYADTSESVTLHTLDGQQMQGDVLIGADGLWSRVRDLMLADDLPRVTGHLAYRTLLPQSSLPQSLRSQQITAWLGPRLHVVQYPVRGGEWLNIVAIVNGRIENDLEDWDHRSNAEDLQKVLSGTCSSLQELIKAVPEWRLWALCDRQPMTDASEHAQGRVCLLGDAAHPMRPYLAQGAGMAIEDAAELGQWLAKVKEGVLVLPEALRQFSEKRWQRNARVQARSIRNGKIFHLTGAAAWARDASMKMMGERLLDVPWLYGGG